MATALCKRSGWLSFSFMWSVIALLTAFVTASPIDTSLISRDPAWDLFKRYDSSRITGPIGRGPAETNYPSDEQINAAFIDTRGRPFVFWTELYTLRTPAARGFAHHGVYQGEQVNGILLEECFEDTQFTCSRDDLDSQAWFANFIDRLSGIFADRSGPAAFLVTESYDEELTNPESTFVRMEAPSLLQHQITSIIFVNAHDQTKTKQVDLNTLLQKMDAMRVPSRKEKRDGMQLPFTFNWPGYGDDPDGLCEKKSPVYGYSAGQCGVHITQSRNENPKTLGPSKPLWSLDITIKDDNQIPVGGWGIDAEGGSPVSVTSLLPYVFELRPGNHGNGDSDPIDLAYGAWAAQTTAPVCQVGGYDHGKREMDCGFPC